MGQTNVAEIGHNSDGNPDKIRGLAEEMVNIDSQRKVLNREAADIRESVKDMGEDTDAFKDVYAYFKKKRHEREGYDESHERIFKAIEGTGDLFTSLDD